MLSVFCDNLTSNTIRSLIVRVMLRMSHCATPTITHNHHFDPTLIMLCMGVMWIDMSQQCRRASGGVLPCAEPNTADSTQLAESAKCAALTYLCKVVFRCSNSISRCNLTTQLWVAHRQARSVLGQCVASSHDEIKEPKTSDAATPLNEGEDDCLAPTSSHLERNKPEAGAPGLARKMGQ